MEFETTVAKRAGGVSRVDHTHVTIPTRFVESDGIRFAYRRFGQESGIPLLFFQHFRGGMDHWDPAVTDGFAQDRPVVLFDNAGVAGTTGDTPNTIEAMADHAVAFVGALGLSQVDVLGFPPFLDVPCGGLRKMLSQQADFSRTNHTRLLTTMASLSEGMQ